MIIVKETAASLEFKILVVPKSSRNQIVGVQEDALKVKLTAPPVDGAANKACLAFLAKTFDLPKSALELVAGQSSRRKQVMIRFAADNPGREQLQRVRDLLLAYEK